MPKVLNLDDETSRNIEMSIGILRECLFVRSALKQVDWDVQWSLGRTGTFSVGVLVG
jgi:hypothetical protein